MQSDKPNNSEEPYVYHIFDKKGWSQEGDEANSAIKSEVAMQGVNGDVWTSSRKENEENRITSIREDLNSSISAVVEGRVDRTSTLGEDQTTPRSDAERSGTLSFGVVWTPSRKEAGGDRSSLLGEYLPSSITAHGQNGTSRLGEDGTPSRSDEGVNGASALENVLNPSGKEAGGNRISLLAEDLTFSRSAAVEGKVGSKRESITFVTKEELIQCCMCGKTAPLKTQLDKINNYEKPVYVCNICDKEGSSQEGNEASAIISEVSLHGVDRTSKLREDLTSPRSAGGGNGTSSFGDDQKSPRNDAGVFRTSSLKEESMFSGADSEGYSILGCDLAPSPEKDDDSSLQGGGSLLGGDDQTVKAETMTKNASRHNDDTNHSVALATSSKVLQLHIKPLSPKDYFTCDICDKIFCRAFSLKRHERVHNNDRPFSCDICGRAFSSRYSLNRHGRVHASTKITISRKSSASVKRPRTCDVKCRICSQSLPGESSLVIHLKEVHPGEKSFICNICEESFSTKFCLKRHKSRHSMTETTISTKSSSFVRRQKVGKTRTCDVKELECRFCDQFLPSTSFLIRHVRQAHPGKKPFSCKICGKGFLNLYNLKRHRRCHTMKETNISKESPASPKLPHTCDVEGQICGQSQFSETSPTLHVRRDHPGENADSCETLKETNISEESPASLKLPHTSDVEDQICEQPHPYKTSPTFHVRKAHPSKKMYSCTVCGKTFSTLYSLERHRKIHIDNKSVSLFCDICGISFMRKSGLKRHQITHIIKQEDTCGKLATVTMSLQLKQECLSGSEEKHHRATNDAFSLTLHNRYNDHNTESNDGNDNGDAFSRYRKSNFECVSCGTKFQSVPSLQRHNVDVHSLDKVFACEICGKSFLCQRTLRRHDIVHNQNETTAAGELSSLTESSPEIKQIHVTNEICSDVQVHPNLNEHSRIAPSDNSNVNSRNEFPSNRYSVEGQDAGHINQEPSDVDASQGVSLSFDRLIKTDDGVCIKLELSASDDHRGESSQLSFSEMCPRASSSVDCPRRNHQSIHTKKKTFICEICGKSLADKFTLFEHQRTHTKEQPFMCNICFRSMRYLGSYKKHMKLHEKDNSSDRALYKQIDRNLSNPKCFVCVNCKRSFERLSNLKRHYLELHSKKTTLFVCEFCNKSFKLKYRLEAHKSRIHSKIKKKPILCEVCGKRFIYCSTLKVHQLVHNGEKPFSCKLCGASFNQPNSLTRHERIHSNEKPYVCVRCGRAFSQDCSLKRHQKVHEKRSASEWVAETDGEDGDGSETDGEDGESDDGSETDGADGEGSDGSEADGEGDDGS